MDYKAAAEKLKYYTVGFRMSGQVSREAALGYFAIPEDDPSAIKAYCMGVLFKHYGADLAARLKKVSTAAGLTVKELRL